MRILKVEIPIDDQWHEVSVGNGVIHVGHQREGFVTLWFVVYGSNTPPRLASYRVYGTGHEIEPLTPKGGNQITIYPTYVATVQAPSGLVWHLVQR